ncbi:MAG: carbohydrate ABC transporter permease [Chloroflexi bacterium]|nr:MAG: carbohydrate ABC transporter permease [Chloroflexota bacterium]
MRSLSSGRKYAWLTLNYLLMVLLAIFFLFPTVFMMVSSLKANENQLLQDLSTVNAFIPYGDISLQNYSDAFHRLPFGLYMFNSALIVTCIVALGLVLNSLIAYALARIPFPGRKLIVVVIVALIVIPFESVVVPLLLMVNQFPWFGGSTTWIDSYQVQTRGDTYRPLMVGMDVFFGQSPLRWGDIMAFASMIILPVLIAFLLFQKWFLRSVATTGIIG